VGGLKGHDWKELGPLLTPYATTLVDRRGIASSLTKEFLLTQYDPTTEKVTSRPITVDGETWTRKSNASIPIWQLDPDGRHAWLILMNDPTLLKIDLHAAGETVVAENCGKMLEGEKPDCRSAMTFHPDGKLYVLIKVQNTTGFGKGTLHHLVRYDRAAKKHEDLGVLKVANPNYFDFSPGPDGKKKNWSHGFHTLPDGTLTPLHAHMGLIAAHDGTLYATVLYPYTLLRIERYKLPAPKPTAAATYLEALAGKLVETRARVPELAKLAEELAERHLRGGVIKFPWIGSTLEQELSGRSGGMMHTGHGPKPEKERTAEEKAADVMFFAWDDVPRPTDLKRMQKEKANGVFLVGFGAKDSPLLVEHAALCDKWIDSGGGANDRVVPVAGERRVGKTNHFTNALNGWVITGEFVGALTRAGKMPPMYKSVVMEGGLEWSAKYKDVWFHEDFTVPPQPSGAIGGMYLDRIEYLLGRLRLTQIPALQEIAAKIDAELREGRNTITASSGHMVMNYVGRYDDALWSKNHEVHGLSEAQMKKFETTPESALVLRLGTNGLEENLNAVFERLRHRVMLLTTENPSPDAAFPTPKRGGVDYGGAFPDACVWLEGYPIPILPTTGVMQVAAYEAINVEVHGRQPAR
jgi:hypothetical protein